MLGFLCTQPIYDDGKGTPAPAAVMPSPFGWLGDLWSVPTPAYQGQASTGALAPSSGFLCWLLGSPTTPAYQTAPVPGGTGGTTGTTKTTRTTR